MKNFSMKMDRLSGLRLKLAQVVAERESLTDPRVIEVSQELDEVVLDYVRKYPHQLDA